MTDVQLAEIKVALGMMARHMHGEKVSGMRVTERTEPNGNVIHTAADGVKSEIVKRFANTRVTSRHQK